MRGRLFFLMIVALFVWSCEDPTTLPVSKVFSANKLQSVFIDTFSVVTSVVQLDSIVTSGSGTLLLGKYKDVELGDISVSSYFQILPSGVFLPDRTSVFDSIVLVLPYSHDFVGDTTTTMRVNVHQLTQQMIIPTFPNVPNIKVPIFNFGNGFYNTSKMTYKPTPIVSKTIKVFPRRDTVTIRMPDDLGKKWFSLAQYDSGRLFSNPINFINAYFYGLHINVDPSTNACVVGFKTAGVKVRMYYKRFVGNYLVRSHTDFTLSSNAYQFNHIDYDRSGTSLASLQKLHAMSTKLTNNTAYVQMGAGLVTRLDFPSLKNFISINNGVILNAAYLEVYPIRGSYPKTFLPPPSLQLYATDESNMPLSVISGASAGIQFDYEHQVNTLYRYQLFPFVFGELKSNSVNITPLIIAPIGNMGGSVQRLYFGDRSFPNNQIKLKIYYSFVLN